MSILDEIVARTRADLADQPPDMAALERAAAKAPPVPDALAALRGVPTAIIAEVKRSSPSAGRIGDIPDPVALARTYAGAGAAVISVLTEPHWFGGSLDDLRSVAAAVDVACLRKDFIVGDAQLLQARAAGAGLVLLIVAALTDHELRDLRERAEALGLQALVEAHTEDEVRRANASGARIVGVNNRDLTTFEIDLAVSERLRGVIAPEAVAVAESGIGTRGDVERLRAAGYSAFLVGSSLVRSGDPGQALRELLGGSAA